MKYFEFVCSRNEGRSPVAELIAQWYLTEWGLADRYGARSSGSHRLQPGADEVQSTADAQVPFDTMEKLLLLAVAQGVFSSEEKGHMENALHSKDMNVLRPLYLRANATFKDHERHFRADAVHRLVEDKGLYGYLKAHSDQTEPHADTIAIFAMAPNNTEKVREIYEGSGLSPFIENLSAYVTGDSEAKLPNAFAQGESFYHDVIDQLWEQVPKGIEKFLSYNL